MLYTLGLRRLKMVVWLKERGFLVLEPMYLNFFSLSGDLEKESEINSDLHYMIQQVFAEKND